jgi:hypothetical protein
MAPSEWKALRIEWPEKNWWTDPELLITLFPPEPPYAVTVEFQRDADGPFVTGIAVRRHVHAGWDGKRTQVSPRDVQRLPLAMIVRAAVAAASSVPAEPPTPRRGSQPLPGSRGMAIHYIDDEESHAKFPRAEFVEDARRILMPRGRPQRGKSVEFYRDLAETHRAAARAGKSPAKEIARRKGVSANTAHQWIHRTRQLGFLEPSPRSKQKEVDDDAR